MSKTKPTIRCAGCAKHQRELLELKQQVALLKAELAKARKNSRNSSKPPSSDITKPKGDDKKKRKGKKRKPGGQKGHPRHERPAFDESEIDHFWDYAFDCCPDCGGPVEESGQPPITIQQIELAKVLTQIDEHRAQSCWCSNCQKMHQAPLPKPLRKVGLVGPKLTALIAYLKGVCHCSFSTIRKLLRNVLGLKISHGKLVGLIRKTSDSLDDAYQLLLDMLPSEARLNVDETGHKDNGDRMWTWCFRAAVFTLFKISPSRGSKVLLEVLGEEFDGVLGCDYFSAYRKYMKDCGVLVQFCLAHLIRDIKFLTEHPNPKNRSYGQRVLDAVRKMFGIIHRHDEIHPDDFAADLEDAGNALWAAAICNVPDTAEAQNLANRFNKHGEAYLRFITTPGVEPTNNLAEQAIRFVVIDRRITQGSRSQAGQQWLERIWTIVATCTQQGRSVFEFLHQSILAYYNSTLPPNLAPDTS